MIICENLSFSYENEVVLNNVKFNLKKGNIGVLLGVNGSGKTTLLNCIGGNYSHKGYVKMDQNARFIQKLPDFCDQFTGREYLDMLLSTVGDKNKNQIDLLIESIGITKDIMKPIKDVSLFTKNILIMLSALCLDSETIILDDPIGGLDHQSQKKLVDLLITLKEQNKTILISSNKLYFGFDIADEILVLHKGKVKQYKNMFKSMKQYENKVMTLLLK